MSLVAHYRLDESSGTLIRDSIGNNNGTWAGTGAQAITIADSPLSSAIVFDGGTPGNDVITVGADPSIDINGKTVLSISAWINPASDGEGNLGRIVNKFAGTVGYLAYVQNEAGGFVELYCTITHDGVANATAITNPIAPINTCSHLSFVYNEDSAKKIKIYLNSSLVTLDTNTAGVGAVDDDSAIDLTIGNTAALTRTFDGSIANIMIFDHALTPLEVERLYNGGVGTDAASDIDPKIRTRRLETANSPTIIRY